MLAPASAPAAVPVITPVLQTQPRRAGRWSREAAGVGFGLWAACLPVCTPGLRPPHSPAREWCCGQRRTLRSQRRGRRPGERGEESGLGLAKSQYTPAPSKRTPPSRVALPLHRNTGAPPQGLGNSPLRKSCPCLWVRQAGCPGPLLSHRKARQGHSHSWARTLSTSTCPLFTKFMRGQFWGSMFLVHTPGSQLFSDGGC